MKNLSHTALLQVIACTILFLATVHTSLLAQNISEGDAVKNAGEKPRTALLMKQSERINQKIDTAFAKPNPKVATWLALVPGLGQIYNKKYWKLPIVYAGFAATGYFAATNRTYYLDYKNAYICKVELGTDCEDPLAQKYSDQDLVSLRDYYRRNMELSFIIMGAWYILQILDATVDAHLYYWEIDDDATVSVHPTIDPSAFLEKNNTVIQQQGFKSYNGLTISVRF